MFAVFPLTIRMMCIAKFRGAAMICVTMYSRKRSRVNVVVINPRSVVVVSIMTVSVLAVSSWGNQKYIAIQESTNAAEMDIMATVLSLRSAVTLPCVFLCQRMKVTICKGKDIKRAESALSRIPIEKYAIA